MRTFIAIDVSKEIKKELIRVIDNLKKTDADVKWVKVENMHLTLKFLGEIKEQEAEDVKTAITGVSSKHKSFDISLFKIGAFPKLDHPSVIWAGIDQGCALVEEIASQIDDECVNIGFEKEKRPFSAHLTLGRVRGSRNKSALKEKIIAEEISQVVSRVDCIVLYKSMLTPNGPIYEKLHQAGLGI